MKQKLCRTIHPEIRILDESKGLVEYVASDETVDSYREVIRADGWRFNLFNKNAPFVDSHNYHCIDKLLGKVTDVAIKGKRLIETVQWAKDVQDNKLAKIGWQMTVGGFLKAVSVGFFPTKWVSHYDGTFDNELEAIGQNRESGIRRIFLEQEQIELSACIIGANPNALAKAYKAEVINDDDLQTLSSEFEQLNTPAISAMDAADAELAKRQRRETFYRKFEQHIKTITNHV